MCRPGKWIRSFILFFLARELDVPGIRYNWSRAILLLVKRLDEIHHFSQPSMAFSGVFVCFCPVVDL